MRLDSNRLIPVIPTKNFSAEFSFSIIVLDIFGPTAFRFLLRPTSKWLCDAKTTVRSSLALSSPCGER